MKNILKEVFGIDFDPKKTLMLPKIINFIFPSFSFE